MMVLPAIAGCPNPQVTRDVGAADQPERGKAPGTTMQRCLAGDDESCDTILAGVISEETGEWTGIPGALCRAGVASYCSTHDEHSLELWRRACEEGSYRSCKAAIVLQDLIVRDELRDTDDARRDLTRKWCTPATASPSSSPYACYDLVSDHEESLDARASALATLQEACEKDAVEACGRVAAGHLSLIKQSQSDVFDEPQRAAARTLIDQHSKVAYENAIERLARICSSTDWAACGFCGDRREGHAGKSMGIASDTVPSSTRQQCDSRWSEGAVEFRATVLSNRSR